MNDAEREYREGQGDDQLEMERLGLRAPKHPVPGAIYTFEWRLNDTHLVIDFPPIGQVWLTTEQARQLGSALLAEVEIATRGDIT